MTLVREVMSPGAITVSPSTSIVDAAKLMRNENVGSVLVVSGGKLIGILTERDLAEAVARGKIDAKVEEFMTRNLITVKPDDPLVVAVSRMVEANIRHLPVVNEKGIPIGMLSVRDVLRHIL